MMPKQLKNSIFSAVLGLVVWLSSAGISMGRNIFLNGVDISSTRGQLLESVTIQIDDKGDLFINAPNYVVQEEDNYVPLTKAQQAVQTGWGTPEHKAPIPLQGPRAKKKNGEPDEVKGAPQSIEAAEVKPVADKTPLPPSPGVQGVAGKTATESAGSESKAPPAKVP